MSNTYDLIFDDNQKFKDYFLNNEDESITYLPKFNSINIIVGANNSGKSRFMRCMMSVESFEGVNSIHNIKSEIKDYNLRVRSINSIIDEKYKVFEMNSNRTIYVNGQNSDKKKAKTLYDNMLSELNFDDLDAIILIIENNKIKINALASFLIKDDYVSNYSGISRVFLKRYNEIKKYYVPTLRTAHSLFKLNVEDYQKIENDIYLDTLNNYYKLNNLDVEVFTGIHLYKEILNTRNSKREIRQSFEKFEKFISVNFFGGKQIDIVAEFNKDESLRGNNNLEIISVHIEGEKETRNLFQLGDGIQALIILMYKIFMAKPNAFIFIDEPEINLHPGMQRLFLEQICTNPDLKKKDLKYIISTHSNHFLDLSIEKENVSIYLFSPQSTDNGEKQFTIKNVNHGDNQILKNLGVNNSSVFMANSSIWVEGISDRNYIKAFLKSYTDYLYKNDKKSYMNLKEDIDFAFFEYAGSNIDHYFFKEEIEKEDEEEILKDIKALSLSNRIFLLADSDSVTKTSNKTKYNRLISLESSKTDNFVPKICWNIREVENLLTNEIWKKILINFCNENLVKKDKAIIQGKIISALESIDSTKYGKKYIGEFLNNLRDKIGKIGKSFILNKSLYEVKKDGSFGTIINKRKLSELIFEENLSWEILSMNKEIESLTIEIYNFIIDKD